MNTDPGRKGGGQLRAAVGLACAMLLVAVTPVRAEPTPSDSGEDTAIVEVWNVIATNALGGHTTVAALNLQWGILTDYSTRLINEARSVNNESLAQNYEATLKKAQSWIDQRILVSASEAQLRADAERAGYMIRLVLLLGSDEVDISVPLEPSTLSDDLADVFDPGESALEVLSGHIAATIPGSVDVLNSTLPELHNFSAGLPVGSSTSASGATTRPIRFDNAGFEPATVRVATYVPGAEATGAAAPASSTVVFPSGGSSAVLELPVGAYTFCYEWQVDGDADGDGKIDFAHRSTGDVSVTTSASEDPATATLVTIRPESTTANGRCGDSITNDASAGTTPQEIGNEGLHSYAATCLSDDGEQDNAQLTISVEYTEGGATIAGPSAPELFEAASQFMSRSGPNTFTGDGDGFAMLVTMTDAGALLFIEYSGFISGTIDCTLTRTS